MTFCSIIIPAHNEERVIGRLLAKLVERDIGCEIIVVCNGCSDNTVEVVKSFASTVRYIETPIASKTNALQIGDFQASCWPRIYMDADVLIDTHQVERLVKSMEENSFEVGAPVVVNVVNNSSWPVKSFYNIWSKLPYYNEGMIGTGVYCLSESGRSRFLEWPDIISDDGFVRSLFSREQRGVCRTAEVKVTAPKTLKALVGIKTRSRLGRYQIERCFPELYKKEQSEKKYIPAFLDLMKKPNLWVGITVYLMINIVSRVRAKMQLKYIDSYKWEKDWSTR